MCTRTHTLNRYPGVVAHTCNSSIQEADVGELLQVQGQHGLHNEFQASVGYSETLSQQNETNGAW